MPEETTDPDVPVIEWLYTVVKDDDLERDERVRGAEILLGYYRSWLANNRTSKSSDRFREQIAEIYTWLRKLVLNKDASRADRLRAAALVLK